MKKHLLLLFVFFFSCTLWAYDIVKDNFSYNIDDITKTATVVDYDDSNLDILGMVIIQREIYHDGEIYKITSIGDNAFDFCHKIKDISIPRTVTKIGNAAFYACNNLEYIRHSCVLTSLGEGALDETLWLSNQPNGCVYFANCLYKYKGEMPENTSVEVIDGTLFICDFAFESCDNLVNITFPNTLKYIGRYAFSGCKSLTSIIIPNSVDSIAIMAFTGCQSLVNVELSTSLNLLKSNIFSSCGSLTSIDLSHITNIEFGALSFCSSLESVVFSDSLSIIDKYAFLNCEKLDSLIFPASLDSIGESAFYGCSGIKYMEVQAITPPRIHKNTFGSVSRDIEFIVPTEAYSAYASHEYWKVFMGGEEITFDEHITDKLNNIYYNSQGKILYFNVDSPRVVVVYDTMGRIIMKEVVDATTQQLFLDLNRGIYVINITTTNQSTVQNKIIVK